MTANGGAIAVISASVMAVVVAAAGMSLDYAVAANMRSKIQSLADAAVLTAASGNVNVQDKIAAANEFFDKSASTKLLSQLNQKLFSIDTNDNSISASISANVDTYFMSVMGIDTIEVAVAARAVPVDVGNKVLDIAMCIDASGSMQNTIDAVRNNATNFEVDLNAAIQQRGLTEFDLIRVRPIFYRDFGGNNPIGPGGIMNPYNVNWGGNVDKYPNGVQWRPAGDAKNYGDDVPLKAANFYELPAEASNFNSFVNSEDASGGGDLPESGLECINEAIDSAWLQVGDPMPGAPGQTVRQAYPAIVLWTDAEVQAPGFSFNLLNPSYPSAAYMPRDYGGLLAKWNDANRIDQERKLLAVFMPSGLFAPNWNPIKQWPNYMNAGTLSSGNSQMIAKIADAIATIKQASPGVALVY